MGTPSSGTEDTVSADASADTVGVDEITRPPSDGPASPPWRDREVHVPTDPAHLPLVSSAHYVQLDEVGRGGLGRIVRARDTRTGRMVAIKEMRVESADAAARFVREALVTANLQHPAIVPVYEVGRWSSGQPFYAMKLVTGRPLTQVIAAAGDLDRRLALLPHVIAVADALAYAHGERVIHRDLKPGNVMVGAHGETVVIDWGLARRLDQGDVDSLPPVSDAAPGETVLGSILGTPQFMAPEQARGERVDERVDVYAIGAMLYHTLSGRPPFDGLATSGAVIEAVRTRPPQALAELAPGTPRDLLAVVERAMAREVDDRYATAAALADDLRRFATGQLVSAHRYSRGERARRFARRYRGMLAIAAVALATTAVLGAISINRIVREREAARTAERGQRAARAEADTKRAEAQRQLAVSYIERARAELARRQPHYAAPLLAAAARISPARTDLAILGATVTDALPVVKPTGLPPGTGVHFLPGGGAIIATEADLRRWSPIDGSARWLVPMARTSGIQPLDDAHVIVFDDTGAKIVAIEDGTVVAHLGDIPAGGDDWIVSGRLTAGRWLALKGPAGHVEVWDVRARRRAGRFTTGLPRGYALASPDGARVFVAGGSMEPQEARIFDVATGRAIVTVCAAKEPCGRTEPAAGKDVFAVSRESTTAGGAVSVFDWTGRLRHRVELESAALSVEIVEDMNAVVAVCHDGAVVVRDLHTGARRWSSHALGQGYGHFLQLDERRLWVYGRDGGVALFQLDTGVLLGDWWIPNSPIGLFVAPRAAHVLTFDPTLGSHLWTPRAIDTQVMRPTPGRVWRTLWLDDHRVVTGSDDGTIAVHDSATGEVMRRLRGHEGRIVELQRLPGGRLLSTGSDNDVVIWDLGTGAPLARIEDIGRRAMANPEGTIVAAGDETGRVSIQPVGGERRELGTLPRGLMTVRWSPDGKWIAAIDDGGAVVVWRADDGHRVRGVDGIPAPRLGGIDVQFSPDSRYLAMGRLGRPMLFDLVGGGEVYLRDAPEDITWALAFSDDSERIATSEDNGNVTVWSTRTGEPIMRIKTPGITPAIAFTGDGRTVVTGSIDRIVRLWDLDSGAILTTYTAPDEVYNLRLSPDLRRLSVGTLSAAVLWRPPHLSGNLAELVEVARCRSGFGLDANGVIIPSSADDLRGCP